MFERFTVIPSIDLRGGQVVRLLHGDLNSATVYGNDPAAVAREFERQGAELIHIVDLDGAVAGEPRNLAAIRTIREAVGCGIDVSGGIRSIESVRAAFRAGADYVSIGSAAFLKPELLKMACTEFGGRVFGSLDMRGGKLAIKGWTETSELSVEQAASIFRSAGAAAVIATDIARDGAETGVDSEAIAALAERVAMPVIASGGVASLNDITALTEQFDLHVVGVVIGRALYENRFSLSEAIASARTNRRK